MRILHSCFGVGANKRAGGFRSRSHSMVWNRELFEEYLRRFPLGLKPCNTFRFIPGGIIGAILHCSALINSRSKAEEDDRQSHDRFVSCRPHRRFREREVPLSPYDFDFFFSYWIGRNVCQRCLVGEYIFPLGLPAHEILRGSGRK